MPRDERTIVVHEGALPHGWDAYVAYHPKGTWYHQSRWKQLIEDTFGHRSFYLVARRDGSMVGVLPMMLVSSWTFGRILVSSAYASYGGICADDAATTEQLLATAKSMARELGVDYLELRNIELINAPELHLNTFKQTFWLSLSDDPDAMCNRFRSELRNRARKAAALGCRVDVGGAGLLSDYYGVFSRRMRELGTPVYPRTLFENLLRIYRNDVCIVAAYADRQAIGAGLMVFDRDWATMPWICSLGAAFKLYPNNAMYMEAIRYAIRRGCRRFDFGTSNAGSGHAEFKRRWGADTIQLHRQCYLLKRRSAPDLTPHNARFVLAIRAWRRLPLALTNWLGPRITRGIP
jgi:FemAB-related protein (PEP-CTERM system-associated)